MQSAKWSVALRTVVLAIGSVSGSVFQAQASDIQFGYYQREADTQCFSNLNFTSCLVTLPVPPAPKSLRVDYVACTIDVPSTGMNITAVVLSATSATQSASLPFSTPAPVPLVAGKRSIVAHSLTFLVLPGKAPKVVAIFSGVGLGKLSCTVVGTLLAPVS